MSKQNSTSAKTSGAGLVGQRWLGWVLLAVLVVVAAAVVMKSRSLHGPMLAGSGASSNQLQGASPGAPSFQKLVGRWMRPDGGYVLEIKRAGDDGQLEAAYYNPQPIHVSRAVATRLGSHVKVEVELRDTGYPGCLYTLLWEPGREDFLRGTYYQAALGETFEIQFERLKQGE